MDKLMQVFQYNGAQVRVVEKDGEPWFVAKDVLDVLDLGNVTETLKRLEQDEFSSTEVIDALGRKQQSYIVNEAGLYTLILRSDKSEAKDFRRWITHEVLPQIRKTGSYSLDRLPTHLETAKALVAALERQALLEAKIEQDKPKVEYAETVAYADGNHTIAQAAKIFGIKELGPYNFFRFLRQEGILRSDEEFNLPTQHYINEGYFRVVEKAYSTHFGNGAQIRRQTVVTGKGMQFLERLLRKRGYLEAHHA